MVSKFFAVQANEFLANGAEQWLTRVDVRHRAGEITVTRNDIDLGRVDGVLNSL